MVMRVVNWWKFEFEKFLLDGDNGGRGGAGASGGGGAEAGVAAEELKQGCTRVHGAPATRRFFYFLKNPNTKTKKPL